jgi:hypothetical protein
MKHFVISPAEFKFSLNVVSSGSYYKEQFQIRKNQKWLTGENTR